MPEQPPAPSRLLFDKEDRPCIAQYAIYERTNGGHPYFVAYVDGVCLPLAKVVLGLTKEDKCTIKHKQGNYLDFCKRNLVVLRKREVVLEDGPEPGEGDAFGLDAFGYGPDNTQILGRIKIDPPSLSYVAIYKLGIRRGKVVCFTDESGHYTHFALVILGLPFDSKKRITYLNGDLRDLRKDNLYIGKL